MTTPSEILVVDDDVPSLSGLLALLRNLGYRSTGAADVVGGCALLEAFPFDMLITDIRLHGESGLKLIRRAREVRPSTSIIAITGYHDPAIEAEVALLNAIYMRKPLDIARLRDILTEFVASGRRQRRWNRKPVAGGFNASLGGVPAKITDISYGGCRFQMAAPPDPSHPPRLSLNLLPFGFTVNAQLVWITRNEPTGWWSCGASVSGMDSSIERAWRVVVDALPESSSQ
jgi:CheY-like chemotaxis protein